MVSGSLVLIVGLLAGLAAKQTADIASFLVSQPTRSLAVDPTAPIRDQIALRFDPSSAHHVAADYTGFWIGIVVGALGLIAVFVGAAIAFAKRRSGASAI